MADNTTSTTSVRELLDEANHALFRASETLSFIRKCLDKGPALDEPDIDGLNNILEGLHRQIDEASDATDKAVTLYGREIESKPDK